MKQASKCADMSKRFERTTLAVAPKMRKAKQNTTAAVHQLAIPASVKYDHVYANA